MKRFTETNIWDEDWFLELPKEYKLFWFYLKDKCNHAGIWRPNKKLFEVMIEVNIDLKKAEEYFNKEKKRVEILKSGHWYILDFFVFQYGKILNPLNRVHKSIESIYNQEDIDLTSIRGLIDHKDGVKDKDKDKDKDSLGKEGVGEKPKEEEIDYIQLVIGTFSNQYKILRNIDYEIMNEGKERSSAGKLLNLYKKKYPNSTSEETLAGLDKYFESCLLITDTWLNQNMSLPTIINQFNKINNILKNGQSKQGVTNYQLASIIAKNFASDYKK